jgi:hypothetical protein
VARANHATTLVDLSLAAIAVNGHRPPTEKSGGGGDPVQSTDALTRAYHAPMYGILEEPILVLVKAEDDDEANGEARVL